MAAVMASRGAGRVRRGHFRRQRTARVRHRNVGNPGASHCRLGAVLSGATGRERRGLAACAVGGHSRRARPRRARAPRRLGRRRVAPGRGARPYRVEGRFRRRSDRAVRGSRDPPVPLGGGKNYGADRSPRDRRGSRICRAHALGRGQYGDALRVHAGERADDRCPPAARRWRWPLLHPLGHHLSSVAWMVLRP